jgi:uncharacterized protein (TIGR03435 family)
MYRLLALIALASAAAQTPGFEVATVKVNRSGSGGTTFPQLRKGVLRAENVSFRLLLQAAFGLPGLRIAGAEWLDDDRFDVTGKSPDGVADTQLMPMLQTLLRERFRLVAHREMRDMSVYHLVVAKEGLRMTRFDPAHPQTVPRNRAAAGIAGAGAMPQLASMLTSAAGRIVIDHTGLEGRYSYSLSFSPLSASNSGGDSSAPDLVTALREQLGLALESKREAVEVLVVDHVDRTPLGN